MDPPDQTPLLRQDTKLIPPPLSSFSSGTLNCEEYEKLLGFGSSTLTGSFPSEVPFERRKKIIIVGAGICGIQQAILLLKDGNKLRDMMVFDALDGFGGVWRKNTYPGCACDVPSMMYSTSWWLNKDWTHDYADRKEIEIYYTEMAHAFKLQESTSFHSYVRSCVWDEDSYQWKVTVDFSKGGSRQTQFWISEVVIHCVGQLDRPKFGTTPGLKNFNGKYWHTNLWPKPEDGAGDVDGKEPIKGKRVAVIGCGSSAAQVIPAIIDDVEHLTVFMRTPPVVLPRMDMPLPTIFKWTCRWIPLFAWIWRWKMTLEFGKRARMGAVDNSAANDRVNFVANKFMEKQVKDPDLRKLLRPSAKFMCKRPLILSTLYPALSKPNCTVVREKLITYTPTGILSLNESGKELTREFDVIILGTGFNVAQYLEHINVVGRDGVILQDQWREHPEALYGVGISNFPNLFLNFGPNSSAPWLAHQDIATLQGSFVVKLVRGITSKPWFGGTKQRKISICPKNDVERKYNDEIQKNQERFAWAAKDCSTYYKNDDGWLTFTMPWGLARFWWLMRKVRWSEWDVRKSRA